MGFYYIHTQNDESLSEESRVEMRSMEEARSEVVTYLVAAARDEVVADRPHQEMSCVLKDVNGKALLRVNLTLQIDAL